MALLDICGKSSDYRSVLTLPSGSIGTSLLDIVQKIGDKGLRGCVNVVLSAVYPSVGHVRLGDVFGPNGSNYTGTEVVPSVSDVKVAVQYGADGTEFTGTLSVSGGSSGVSRGRLVNEGS